MKKRAQTSTAQEVVEERFRSFLQGISFWRVGEGMPGDDGFVWMYQSRTYPATGEHARSQAAVEAVKSVCPYISEQTAWDAISEAGANVFRDYMSTCTGGVGGRVTSVEFASFVEKAPLTAAVHEMLNRIAALLKPYTCFTAIDGLDLDLAELRLGDATVYKYGTGPLTEVLADLGAGPMGPAAADVKQLFQAAGSYHVAEITGDDVFAMAKSREKALGAAAILNLYLAEPLRVPFFFRKIGVAGQMVEQKYGALCVPSSTASGTGGIGASAQFSAPPSKQYRVDADSIREWKSQAFDYVVECCTSLQNDTARKVRSAVRWYSNGINAETEDEQFVNFAIALESLLGDDSGQNPTTTWGSIGQRLADRVAFLTATDCAARRSVAKRTKDLYRKRSAVVHTGSEASSEEVQELAMLTKQAIFAFAGQHFPSWEAFIDWMAERIYT